MIGTAARAGIPRSARATAWPSMQGSWMSEQDEVEAFCRGAFDTRRAGRRVDLGEAVYLQQKRGEVAALLVVFDAEDSSGHDSIGPFTGSVSVNTLPLFGSLST